MLDAVFWTAAALAFASAWDWPSGRWPRPANPTAWALLASVALCLVLDWSGAVFDQRLWVIIDVIVAAVIVRFRSLWHMSKVDMSILALFPVAWMFYLEPDPWRYYGSLLVVVAQLVLTLPLSHLFARWKGNFKHRAEWSSFDLKAAMA